ncbi:MAG: HEAT repeat domain-containing protein [Nostoc sp. CreGUA01]|nr:HEAT repeat domain-containing protein [Nostoc sp. CreGUA01]
MKLLQSPTLNDNIRRQAAYVLGTIDPGNPKAIAALVKLLQSPTLDDETRRKVTESLGKIGTGNPTAIAVLVQMLQSPNLDKYYYSRSQVAESLGEILQDNHNRSKVVKVLGTSNKKNVPS